jgi:hypothetical protein
MVRASVLRHLGGFRLFPAAQDQDLYCRASECTYLANVPEVLYERSCGSEAISFRKRSDQFWCTYTAFQLWALRRAGERDCLGSSPTAEAVRAYVEENRRRAPTEVRRAVLEKQFNLGCSQRNLGRIRTALSKHVEYVREGGSLRRVAAFWVRPRRVRKSA